MEVNFQLSIIILEILIQNDCRYFVFSPGARNSPIIRCLYYLSQHQSLEIDSHFDERGAGFYALGLAKSLKKPVCVITTSGTATANLLPSIVEGYYSAIPLIALTSDRPDRIKNISSNQTINQENIYANFVHSEINLPSLKLFTKDEQEKIIRDLKGGILSLRQGPIHINCPFDEPLLDETINHDFMKEITHKNMRVDSKLMIERERPSSKILDEFYNIIKESYRGLIIIGELKQENIKSSILDFINFLGHYGWLVIVEINSGIKNYFSADIKKKYFLENYSHLLEKKNFVEKLSIDTIIHIGGRLLSKTLSTFIQNNKFIYYIHIDKNHHHYDPEKKITKHYHCDPFFFCQDAYNFWFKQKLFLQTKYDSIVEENKRIDNQLTSSLKGFVFNEFNELEISRTINAFSNQPLIKNNAILFLGNSMPIRDFALMSKETGFVKVFSNRGASGIDGLIATASGVAKTNPKYRLYGMIGDLSALHDINSMIYVKKNQDNKCPMTLIIINNKEGTIFRYLPLSKIIDQYPEGHNFYYTHDLDFEGIVNTFKLDYHKITSKQDLLNTLQNYHHSEKSVVLEISINSKSNHMEHLRYHMYAMNEIDTFLG